MRLGWAGAKPEAGAEGVYTTEDAESMQDLPIPDRSRAEYRAA